jgi:hypothetical protein
VVPTFYETSYLTQALAANATILSVESTAGGLFPRDRVIRIDSEIMTVVTAPTSSTVQVTRGSFGTQVVPHASGAIISHATNSLRSQLRLPLGTEDGHDYFFVWESYWTDSFIGAGRFNHKAFQFSSGSRDGDQIWLEPQVSYGRTTQPCMNPSVASFQVRSYNQLGGDANWLLSDGNQLGPGATASPSLGPRANFCVEANRWVRFFLHLRQRANDYDPVDVWVADETRDPIQVVMNSPVSVRPTGGTPNSIAKFWIEFNSSEDDYLRVDGRDLVAYVRNFVALRDVGDPRSLLVRPVPGAAPVSGPAPPTNVRLLK